MESQADGELAPRLSRRATVVERSPIRLMFDLADEYDAEDLVHLEIGEPDFDTPDHIVSAGCDAAKAGETHYTANAGILPLREAIAADLAPDIDVDPRSEVTVTSGAMEALHLTMQTVVDPGDEVVIPTPAWPNYVTHVQMAGATPVEVPLAADESFALDPDRIGSAITDDTAAIILTSPSNPTGQVYDPDAVREVIRVAADHGTYVVADEVYKDLVYDDQPTGIAGYTDTSDIVLTVGSVSKTYAMTGWRVGWLVGPTEIVAAANKLHESTTACASSVSQQAALTALTGTREPVEEMRSAFAERRKYVMDRVADLPGVRAPTPDGTFYAFLDFSHLNEPSLDLSKRLMYDYDVVTAPGSGFGEGADGWIRVSFANSLARLEQGFDRIERMLEEV